MTMNAIYSTEQIRVLHYQCGVLRQHNVISSELDAMMTFAIVWAPFGGASAGDVFVKFGIGRSRFLQLLQESFHPNDVDDQHIRTIKSNLVAAVMETWNPSRRLAGVA